MSDLELLEYAAKAAGIQHQGWIDAIYSGEHGGLHVGPPKPWNPLADDGDAFRLAVALDIDVTFDTALSVMAGQYAPSRGSWDAVVDDQPDKLSATRRAIVLAAAETLKRAKKRQSN